CPLPAVRPSIAGAVLAVGQFLDATHGRPGSSVRRASAGRRPGGTGATARPGRRGGPCPGSATGRACRRARRGRRTRLLLTRCSPPSSVLLSCAGGFFAGDAASLAGERG